MFEAGLTVSSREDLWVSALHQLQAEEKESMEDLWMANSVCRSRLSQRKGMGFGAGRHLGVREFQCAGFLGQQVAASLVFERKGRRP